MGAVAAVRLAKSVENGLQTEWAGRWFFTDSTAALGMIRMASGSFQEFVGTRVGKIQSKSDVEEWFWVCCEDNIADMDTRPNMTPEQMKPGSRYQEDNRWMQEDAETWPIAQKFGDVPTEELLSKGKVFAAEAAQDTRLVDVSRFSSLQKLLNTVVLVFKAKARF